MRRHIDRNTATFLPVAALVAAFAATTLVPAASAATEVPQPTAVTRLTVLHVPPSWALPDRPVHLDFDVAEPGRVAHATLVHRPVGESAWRRAPIRQGSTGRYRATLPAAALREPGVDYHVVVRDIDGASAAVFASPAEPHRLIVRGRNAEMARTIALAEVDGLQSELWLAADLVDYRTIGASAELRAQGPRYMDADLRYRYWMLGRVEHVEVGVGRLRGVAPRTELNFDKGVATATTTSGDVGYDRGWARVGFRLKPLFALHFKIDLGADEREFRLGGAVGARLGRPRGTRAEIEVGGAGGVGSYLGFRFDVATIPRVPFGVDVELTNWPDSGAETGERVRVRIGYEVTRRVAFQLAASYQALRGSEHGLGGGGRLQFRF